MKVEVSVATDRVLDYMVAVALGGSDWAEDGCGTYWIKINGEDRALSMGWSQKQNFAPSRDWVHGGPIIEREGIELMCNLTATEATTFKGARADWQAFYRNRRETEHRSFAITPLIAAMRRFVTKHLGDEVEVPEELLS